MEYNKNKRRKTKIQQKVQKPFTTINPNTIFYEKQRLYPIYTILT